MQTHRLKIGWYCPFIFPVVEKRKDIDFLEILWDQYSSIRIGNIELCKKMTAVYKHLKSGILDGLVFVNCCNLSDRLKDIYTGEFEGRILMVEFPRRVDEKMPERIVTELERINLWISSIAPVKRTEKYLRSLDDALGGEGNPEVPDAFKWCRLPEKMKTGKSRVKNHEMIQRLIEDVACPRLITEDLDRVVVKRMEDLTVEDPGCILQCYGKTMKTWLEDRKESI